MTKPDSKELRQFGLLLTAVVAVLWFFIAGTAHWPWLAGIAALLVALALAIPAALYPIHYLLMKFGQVVSKVLNPLLLGLVYFVIITPIGLAMRLFKYDPMRRARDEEADSYRESSDDTATHRFDRPF
jgi:large-conductance mechanosensitive channel